MVHRPELKEYVQRQKEYRQRQNRKYKQRRVLYKERNNRITNTIQNTGSQNFPLNFFFFFFFFSFFSIFSPLNIFFKCPQINLFDKFLFFFSF